MNASRRRGLSPAEDAVGHVGDGMPRREHGPALIEGPGDRPSPAVRLRRGATEHDRRPEGIIILKSEFLEVNPGDLDEGVVALGREDRGWAVMTGRDAVRGHGPTVGDAPAKLELGLGRGSENPV